MATLVDGGSRKEFDGGAMREIVEGKGRCDLLPLDVVAHYMSADGVLFAINHYVRSGNTEYLYVALGLFVESQNLDKPTAMIELSKHYEDGARKYADRNWEKGLPLHSLIDSGVRHYLKVLRGDTDEPHDRAFMWNIMGAIWTQENHPECIDLPFVDKKEEVKQSDSNEIMMKALQTIFDLTNSYPSWIKQNYNCDSEQISSTCEGCKFKPQIEVPCMHSCHRANDGHLTGYTKSEPKPGRGWPL